MNLKTSRRFKMEGFNNKRLLGIHIKGPSPYVDPTEGCKNCNNALHIVGLQKELILQLKEQVQRCEGMIESLIRELTH